MEKKKKRKESRQGQKQQGKKGIIKIFDRAPLQLQRFYVQYFSVLPR